ncbi:hypothetical protein [Orenia marismortui]|uniref:Uncharacterized protein n=1 Tax=Orenia marismortui TaxID=46469 RepID=A0A4R8H191_9FIRM|nr:hypothetical protein [Orenia marismortui]TDX48289.1 hypothetical protein C7959_13016 [Orenia marismortui]
MKAKKKLVCKVNNNLGQLSTLLDQASDKASELKELLDQINNFEIEVEVKEDGLEIGESNEG